MREVKFRGLSNNKWKYGFYAFCENTKHHLIFDHTPVFQLNEDHTECEDVRFGLTPWQVLPETIGQYTGLKDSKGVDSYGSDLCEYSYEIDCDVTCGIETVLLLIKWDDVDFRWGFYDALNGDFYCNLADLRPDEFEIIGNIHTTPELLK